MAELYKTGRFIWSSDVASNSLSVLDWDLVDKVWGFMVKANNTTGVLGIAAGEQSFESDNQTVDMQNLEYIRLDDYSEVRVAIDDSVTSITKADEGNGFDLTAASIVDWATSGTGDALYLRDFISATEWIFGTKK